MPADKSATVFGQNFGLNPTPQSTHIVGAVYVSKAEFTNMPRSELIVGFPASGKSPACRYCYFFEDDAAGRAVYDRLVASEHPWREVGIPELKDAGVPYRRV